MDAFVLGAVPPYRFLLCGKLVAMLAASDTVSDAFKRKYNGTRSVIRGKVHDGRQRQLLGVLLSIIDYGWGTGFSIRAWASRRGLESFTFRMVCMGPLRSLQRSTASRRRNRNAGERASAIAEK
jgi:hypothetical protein